MPKRLMTMIFILLLALGAGLLGCGVAVAAEEAIPVYVDGKALNTDPAPYIVNQQVMVPMRSIFEALGAEVSWNEAEQQITALRGEDQVVLIIGQAVAQLNEQEVTLETVPFIDADSERTLVPLRLVGEALGCTVTWDETARQVTIVTVDAGTDDQTAEKPPKGTVISSSDASILDTVRNRHFAAGDVLRYTVKGGEVDTYEVLYDYSEDKAIYNPVEGRLDKFQGSLLMLTDVNNATMTSFRISEDTIFLDATKEESGLHDPLTMDEFKSFIGSRLLVWPEKVLEPNYRRSQNDVARLVLRVRSK